LKPALSHLYGATGDDFLAKIAVDLQRALARRAVDGAPGRATARLLAKGNGWTAEDVICTSGPHDRPFEERHANVSIAIVAAGSFQYRAQNGSGTNSELMTPGSLLLGDAGEGFECEHDHGVGDRCVSFHYAVDYFEGVAGDVGVSGARRGLRRLRLPPLRALSPLIAQACGGVAGSIDVPWEHLSVELAAQTLQLLRDPFSRSACAPPRAVARVTEIVRMIERCPDAELGLGQLARKADLSPYHFLRTFEHVTGVTPHQYVLRLRLREAAMRLVAGPATVLDVAFDCGFGDISNFNHAFRAEFGVSPRAYRKMPSSVVTSAAVERAGGSASRRSRTIPAAD
jgi:AraC family transcriptional regulator